MGKDQYKNWSYKYISITYFLIKTSHMMNCLIWFYQWFSKEEPPKIFPKSDLYSMKIFQSFFCFQNVIYFNLLNQGHSITINGLKNYN